jgi:signal transduction histidine kinase
LSRGSLRLSTRGWLVGALVTMIAIPALAAAAANLFARDWNRTHSRQAHARLLASEQQLRTSAGLRAVSLATHPAGGSSLKQLGIPLQLFRGGRLLFSTPGFPKFRFKTDPSHGALLRFPRQHEIVAVYVPWARLNVTEVWVTTLILTALLTTCATAAVLERLIIRPLRRLSGAVRTVGTTLSPTQPPFSPVIEIADIGAALIDARTELALAERQRSQIEQDGRLLVAAIAHDLRTPLFVLRGRLEGLRKGISATPAHLDEACANAELLDRLVSDLFAYAQLDPRNEEPRYDEPVSLDSLISETLQTVSSLAADKGIALRALPLQPTEAVIFADRHLLTRALQNLLDNAIRYTPKGGTVAIASCSDADRTTITIDDTGPGIPPDQLPKIFQPFYRGEPSRNRNTGGAGLGLAIASRIAATYHGTLTATNKTSGGAQFTLTLSTGAPQHTGQREAEHTAKSDRIRDPARRRS